MARPLLLVFLSLIPLLPLEVSASQLAAVMLYGKPGSSVFICRNEPCVVFAGSGVVIERFPYKVLTVWHVAAIPELRLRAGCCEPYQSGLSAIQAPVLIRARALCRAPITVLTTDLVAQQASELLDTARVSFRNLKVGEWVTAVGFPDGEPTALNLKISGFQTIRLGREEVKYMILAPVDFEYFPAVMQGMSGGPVFDRFGQVVGLISLEIRAGSNMRFDRVAAVPMTEGLGLCRSRIQNQ